MRLLSGSGFVKGKILELFLIISEKIGRITGEGAKVRRCEDAKVGWSEDAKMRRSVDRLVMRKQPTLAVPAKEVRGTQQPTLAVQAKEVRGAASDVVIAELRPVEIRDGKPSRRGNSREKGPEAEHKKSFKGSGS